MFSLAEEVWKVFCQASSILIFVRRCQRCSAEEEVRDWHFGSQCFPAYVLSCKSQQKGLRIIWMADCHACCLGWEVHLDAEQATSLCISRYVLTTIILYLYHTQAPSLFVHSLGQLETSLSIATSSSQKLGSFLTSISQKPDLTGLRAQLWTWESHFGPAAAC